MLVLLADIGPASFDHSMHKLKKIQTIASIDLKRDSHIRRPFCILFINTNFPKTSPNVFMTLPFLAFSASNFHFFQEFWGIFHLLKRLLQMLQITGVWNNHTSSMALNRPAATCKHLSVSLLAYKNIQTFPKSLAPVFPFDKHVLQT